MSKELGIETLLAHAGINSDEATGALAAPIHFSTTYQHPEFGKSTGFDYTRTKNPTRATLEKTLAAIEKADYAIATSSGMSAIVLAFEIFPVGSKIVAVRDLYGGSFRWFNDQEKQGRFQFTYKNTEAELLEAISDDTDVVYVETPTNPLMIEFDIAKIAELVHAKGAKLIVDNTFYSPIYQNPIAEGADIVVHSATKYLAGHNDVLAGVVVTNDQETYEKLFYNLNTTGPTLSPFDSYMLMRGLKTLKLRMDKSTENARAVAAFLESSSAVKEVLYTGKGGMISFKVADQSKIPAIINTLEIFTFAESLGGVESLITYPTTQTHADIPSDVRASYGLTDDLLRLSIGIEDVQDLIQDLENALKA
ncbi:cystathionine gamma-synthase [Streptococcus saliviloxodontae]|uniref:Cystathionine gamma-synthase n=1 Tax=Streptococcus saliviloxodontae TaxID=1349416 RepID=A0ABS2PL86_9STRE|nr:cystathionine gamma-synthase [Streptococcus saliviloxodontae]MBM7636202.1 cystathionine gamma-synthase [Streptococcus saliviloxodontae]